jgi:hypothetical protein
MIHSFCKKLAFHNLNKNALMPIAYCPDGGRGLMVSSPPATEETGAMGREIETRQGMYRVIAIFKNANFFANFSPTSLLNIFLKIFKKS